MIPALLVIALGFIWLGIETDWLTVRLPVGAIPKVKPIDFDVTELAERIGWVHKSKDYHYKGFAIDWMMPICGWQWLAEHEHDLDNWQPTIEVKAFGINHRLTIKNPADKRMKQVYRSIFKAPKALRLEYKQA